jgi:hypothetical protein
MRPTYKVIYFIIFIMLTEIVSIINSGTVTDGWCYYVNQNNYNALKMKMEY